MTRRLAIACLAAGLAFAADPIAGSWKANLEKSQRDPNHKFSQASLRIEVEGGKVRLAIEGVNQAGKAVSSTQEFIADGKERPAQGAPEGFTAAATRDARSFEMTGRKDGKVVGRGRYAVSADGKELTVTTTGVDEKGREYKAVVVFDRQ